MWTVSRVLLAGLLAVSLTYYLADPGTHRAYAAPNSNVKTVPLGPAEVSDGFGEGWARLHALDHLWERNGLSLPSVNALAFEQLHDVSEYDAAQMTAALPDHPEAESVTRHVLASGEQGIVVELIEGPNRVQTAVHFVPNQDGKGSLLVDAITVDGAQHDNSVSLTATSVLPGNEYAAVYELPLGTEADPIDQACQSTCNLWGSAIFATVGIACFLLGAGLGCTAVSAAGGLSVNSVCQSTCVLSRGNFFTLGADCPDGLYCNVNGSVATMRKPTASASTNADVVPSGGQAYVLVTWIRGNGTKIFTDHNFSGSRLSARDPLTNAVAGHNFRFSGIVFDDDSKTSRVRCTYAIELFASVPLLRHNGTTTSTVAQFATSKPFVTRTSPAPPCG